MRHNNDNWITATPLTIETRKILRNNLEKLILSDTLTSAASQIEYLTYLQAQNFKGGRDIKIGERTITLHHYLWECISNMYPKEEINILTVSKLSIDNYEVNIISDLQKLTETEVTSTNRSYYALQILEEDFRLHLLKLLKSYKPIERGTRAEPALEVFREQLLDYTWDIFEILGSLLEYLESDDEMEALHEKVLEFEKKIKARIQELRRVSTLRSITNNFYQLYNFNSPKKLLIESVTNILALAIVTTEIPFDTQQTLIQISKKLYEKYSP